MAASDPSPSHPSPDASPVYPYPYPDASPVPDSMAAVAAYAPRAAPPWLFIPSRGNTAVYAINCFSDSSTPEIYRIRLPKHLHGCDLVSSLGHHLLYEKRGTLSGIRLFNPFSSSTQDAFLPPSATLMTPSDTSIHILPLERRYFHYQIHTVVADADSGIALALIDHGVCRLAYLMFHCTDGNPVTSNTDSWININRTITDPDDDYITFISAALYRKGYFCVVDFTGRYVFALDFSDPASPTMSDITFNLPNNYYSPPFDEVEWCCYQSASLVNSGGSIFLVRWRNTLNKDGVKYRREIDIHSLDEDATKWVPVTTLGDHSFFIGHTNQSFSVSTADFPELQSNRVYISLDATLPVAGDDYTCPYDDHDRDEHGLHLVYNLKDKSWGVFYDDDPPHDSLWMIPDPDLGAIQLFYVG